MLLEKASGRRREWLIAHGDEDADPDVARRLATLVARRIAGEPVAYLVGWREFAGRRFETTPDVLIPRPETELLVQFALDHAPRQGSVLDLGTGSGAVAVTLACERDELRIVATDSSRPALAVARRNAEALSRDAIDTGRLQLREGDWWRAVRDGERFDVVVSNPPYVAEDDGHLRAGDLRFEPQQALRAGADGLAALRTIVAGAPAHVAAGGSIALEHGSDQADAVRGLLADHGWRDIRTLDDSAGLPRITCARSFR